MNEDIFECPGCGKEIDLTRGIQSLNALTSHEMLCPPPGFFDHLAYRDGLITHTMARWVGHSIEKMVRSLQ